jgi:hypothetical protein
MGEKLLRPPVSHNRSLPDRGTPRKATARSVLWRGEIERGEEGTWTVSGSMTYSVVP